MEQNQEPSKKVKQLKINTVKLENTEKNVKNVDPSLKSCKTMRESPIKQQVLENIDEDEFNFNDYIIHTNKPKANLMSTLSLFRKLSVCRLDRLNVNLMYNDDDLNDKKPVIIPIEKETCKPSKKINSNKNITLYNLEFNKNITNINNKVTIKTIKSSTDSKLEKGVNFHVDPNSRNYMEDFINIDNIFKDEPHHEIYILSDGHSGSNAAEIVIKLLPEIFDKCLKQNKASDIKEKIVQKAILESFYEMDLRLHTELEEDDCSGCCTNLIYLCIEDDKRIVYSGNVGDSRSILIRENTSLRLSYDHKATDKREEARVKEEGGVIIRKRLFGTLQVTRTLGDLEMKETAKCLSNKPHITRYEIIDTDKFLIMASDGIWDVMKDKDVFDLIKSTDLDSLDKITNKPKEITKILVKKAIELGSKDNISCIAIKLN